MTVSSDNGILNSLHRH